MTIDDETAERIVSKAEYIRDCLEILATKQSLTKDAYLADRETQDVVERRFETTIQACLDIASQILKAEGESIPEVYADRMRALVDSGILSAELGERMAATAGFRNILAHQYGISIDDELVYESLQDLTRFHEYLTAIKEYLSEQNAL
jgi:uncharacterized protein YutE (UPF0331/DUF86 family)